MGPVAQGNGSYVPGLIDEPVPGVAAVVENVGVGGEDAVGEAVFADKLPDILDRIEFGRLAGRGIREMLAGTVSVAERCQPAWSSTTTA